MSIPANPLAQYNTYSYHHIFLACETTEVAEALSKSKNFLDFMRNPEEVNTVDEPFGKYVARTLRGVKGKYIIIINGMTDAEFVIRKANWFSATAEKASVEDSFETLSIEGEMIVDEPRGVKFMNVMATVADRMETDPNGLIFMMKTVFFGHKSSTLSEDGGYDPITNVRPIMMLLYDITGQFTVTGGTYVVKWAGLNHGASKQQHIMRAIDRVKINISTPREGCESDTLWGALCRLEDEVNRIYTDHYTSIKEETEKAGVQFNGKRVVYRILAEEPYATLVKNSNGQVDRTKSEGNSAYVVTDFKPQNTDTGNPEESGIVDFGTSVSVESAILKLAHRCPLVKEDLTSDKSSSGGKVKYVPKVSSTIVSTTDEYAIVYKLHRAVESRNDIVQKVLQRTTDETGNLSKLIQKNLLTLDYFFTGRNTDILNFDLKMEMGLAFYQTLVTTDNLPNNITAAEGKSVEQKRAEANGVARALTPNNSVRKNTPIFLSTKINPKLLRNTQQPDRTATFQFLLNQHAALENLEASITIHGNPGLLNSMNKPPSEILNRATPLETRANDGSRDEEVNFDAFPYWETTPALLKVNIRMPSDEQDIDYSQKFWYEGFYYVFGISNDFDDGQFTQTLEVISLPRSNPTQDTQKKVSETEQKQQAQNVKTASTSSGATTTGTQQSTTAAISEIATIQNDQNQILRTAGKTTNPTNPDNITAGQYLDAVFQRCRT